MAYEVNGKTVEHDEEGYITNLSDWSKELSCASTTTSTRSRRPSACS